MLLSQKTRERSSPSLSSRKAEYAPSFSSVSTTSAEMFFLPIRYFTQPQPRTAVGHHRLLQTQFQTSALEHRCFVRASRDEAIHTHRLRLANPMATSLCLHIVLGIPIGVEDDYCIGRGESDSHTSSTRTQQKAEHVAVLVVERPDRFFASIPSDRAVDSSIGESCETQIPLQNVQHRSKLTEDENAVPFSFQLAQQFMEQHHLSARLHKRVLR